LGLKDPAVVDLVMWKDVKKSGAILGGATAIYALFELSGLTLIELWATAALIVTLTCTVWSMVAGYLGKDGIPLPSFMTSGINEEVVRKNIEKALPLVNKWIAFKVKILKCENIGMNLKIAAALYVTAKVGHYFSVLTLLYLGVVLFMTVPKIYDAKHEEIDKVLDQAMTKVKELQGMAEEKLKPILEKLPMGKAAVKKE